MGIFGCFVFGLLVALVKSDRTGREEVIDVANLQKLASLSPDQLDRTFRYLENPFIAAALVEGDKEKKAQRIAGEIPRVFDEPRLTSTLDHYLVENMFRKQKTPPTAIEASRDSQLHDPKQRRKKST